METTIENWWHDAMQVNILAAGRRELGAWWNFDFTEGIGPWRLYLNDREGATLDFVAGPTFAIPPSTVVLLPPGLRFKTRAWQTVGHFYIHFDVSGMPRVPASLSRAPVCLTEAAAVKLLIKEVSDEIISQSPRLELQWRLKAIVHDAMARLLARFPRREDGEYADVAPQYGSIRHALRMVQDHFAGHLDNATLAAACDMSEDHFIRTFRDVIGTTPAKYVMDFRVRVAAQRIAAGEETLDSIAAACGFAHRSHLSRVFKSHLGVSPSEYRKAG